MKKFFLFAKANTYIITKTRNISISYKDWFLFRTEIRELLTCTYMYIYIRILTNVSGLYIILHVRHSYNYYIPSVAFLYIGILRGYSIFLEYYHQSVQAEIFKSIASYMSLVQVRNITRIVYSFACTPCMSMCYYYIVSCDSRFQYDIKRHILHMK